MGHYTMLVVGKIQTQDIDLYLGREIGNYKQHSEQVLFPKAPIEKNVFLGEAEYMELGPNDCMLKKHVDLEATKKSGFWPPAILLKDGDLIVYKEEENWEAWEKRFKELWDFIDDDDILTIQDIHY